MTGRDAASQAQVRAADPRASTWLSANAGSGKTRVLTDRVARLLFDGVSPQNILCLTYTRAAASEMQNRLFQRLGAWAMMPASTLTQELRTLGVEGPLDGDALRGARTLFARAIESPGGLRIQTIHSFCAGLLRRFPLEAGVSPQFAEIEDRAAAILRAGVIEDLALDRPQVVKGLAAWLSGDDVDPLLRAIAGRGEAFVALPQDADLRHRLGLPQGLTAEDLIGRTIDADARAAVAALIPICAASGPADSRVAQTLAGIPATGDLTLAHLALLEDVFLFGKDAAAPYGAKTGKLPTKALRAAHPDLTDDIDALMGRVEAARDSRLALRALDRSRALHAFAVPFRAGYDAAKMARGVLDFDDLIGKARTLLRDSAVAQWVLFRLDGGIDHILVDEAQDTSPAQWAVIEALAQEFSAGDGARTDRRRTIFVVGDKKQSIYSFQGADPEGFDRMRDHFGAALVPTGGLERHELKHSFRSAASLLRVVDGTFVGPHLEGLGPDAPDHIAFKDWMPGRVDLWPPVDKIKDAPDEDAHWTNPVDRPSARDERIRLAGAIAAAAQEMIATATLPATPGPDGAPRRRRVTPGDILILVQSRGELSVVSLFSEIILACKRLGLAIAGADRLRVGGELAVRDVAALLRFLVLPEDDLSLACALRSPLFGWTEQDLYTLAQPRGDKVFLWQALRDRAAEHPATMAALDDLRARADFLRPYDLINRILTRHDGRRRLLAQLGSEAEDGIDALLSQALSYERSDIPGLTGFVEWLGSGDVEIKRQMDSAGDCIRVMTVHGAKGLEAPIVILPDAARRKPPSVPAILGADGVAGGIAVWSPNRPDMPPAVRALADEHIDRQLRERRRLLYVAMTRAQSWLIVCAAGETGSGGDSWHAMVAEGMAQAGAIDRAFGDLGTGRQVIDPRWDAGEVAEVAALPDIPAILPADPGPVPPPGDRAATLSPSALGGAKVLPGDPSEGDEDTALANGTAMHLLLEHLPACPPDQRAALGARLLAALAEPGETVAGGDLVTDAIGLIGRPEFRTLFSDATLTEVDVTADVAPLNRRLHGAIDRLQIGPDCILAVDYKTNRLVPAAPEDVPEGLLRQMGAYHAMLSAVWPDRRIEVAILWTSAALLMPLPAPLVLGALARSTPP